MSGFNWICPHCQHAQTAVDSRAKHLAGGVGIPNLAEGIVAYEIDAFGCSNPECQKLTLIFAVGEDTGDSGWKVNKERALFSGRLLPQTSGRPQPEYIPLPVREDYYEACAVRELSPKAAATLARRCLQGMIRDFCKISRARLIDEIAALRQAVEDGTADRAIAPETVIAIDHVRKIGNIGAHMERDVGMIVDVDPGEAQALIQLIEMLFKEWYRAREERVAMLARIEAIALAKDIKKASGSAGVP